MWNPASSLFLFVASASALLSMFSETVSMEVAVFFAMMSAVFALWDLRDTVKKGK
jgi:hypothetical protein